jgi:adenosylcobinamide kinase / adenosylcobinamide-phosphate guanylyltransferase
LTLTLILGGARAGKSRLAERLASAQGTPVTVIATATASDDDMRARIARHQADRPDGWATIEEPRDLGAALARLAVDDCVVIDCLTLWTSNLMAEPHDDAAIETEARRVSVIAAARSGPTIVVSNEVGMGVHPETDLGMKYRDVLGRVNAIWARAADRAVLVVAGRALDLLAPDDLLPELRG